MRVITLDNTSLETHCESLADKIRKAGYQPDLILGVQTGGAVIAEKVFSILGSKNSRLSFCHPIRKSTSKKKSFLKDHLKKLPRFVLDFLRIIEYKFLFNRNERRNFASIELPSDLSDYKSILIVDDAVDSGATLKALTEKINAEYPEMQIKTAALTVTGADSAYMPDFYIYNDKTLLRFPWSADMRQ